jgi:hypothetical protein
MHVCNMEKNDGIEVQEHSRYCHGSWRQAVHATEHYTTGRSTPYLITVRQPVPAVVQKAEGG